MTTRISDTDKFYNDLFVDKENDTLIYNDEKHVYMGKDGIVKDKKFTSVTTLIDKYVQPFDGDFWSSYKAFEAISPDFSKYKDNLLSTKVFNLTYLKESNISIEEFNIKKQEILDSYKENNKKACERGTAIHAEQELQYYKDTPQTLERYNKEGNFICKKNHYILDLDKGIYPEFLISRVSDDGVLMIAGQVDLLIKDGNDIMIIDYKGLSLNELIPTPNGFVKMADIKEGDLVYDGNGKITEVEHVSEIHYNPCFKIDFNSGESLIADHEHKWEITSFGNTEIFTTKQLYRMFNNGKQLNIQRCPIPKEITNYHYDTTKEYWAITNIEHINTVPTKCIAVKSPCHTYLAGKSLIKTHNTNKELKFKSFYDKSKKSYQMMKPPLNNIMDCNIMHYTLQLSTYAWMVQKINPDFNITKLMIIHYQHDGKIKEYELEYRKDDVESMLRDYKIKLIKEKQTELNKPIIF